MKISYAFILLIFLMLSAHILAIHATPPMGWAPSQLDYEWVVSNINMTNIEGHIRQFASFSSRFSGYPDSRRAADYIYDFFYNLGLEVSEQPFNVVVPVDYGANITILPNGPVFKLYPFWPNLVSPVTINGSITGHLVYVGGGSLREMSDACGRLGVRIENSILLMDLNSELRWLDAAKLGAKAVIFLGGEDGKTEEFKTKFLSDIPFNFPRLYIPMEDAGSLISLANKNMTAELKSRMRWESRGAVNIISVLNGTLQPDKYVLFTAYYDSFSYVPSLAPGAQEAIGISTLLELAQFFQKNRAIYTIIFVAFSGHNLGLVGSREFVQEYLFKHWEGFGKNVLAVINLDLHTDSSTIAPTQFGGFYGSRMAPKAISLVTYVTDEIIPEVQLQLKKTFKFSRDGIADFAYLNLFDIPFPYDNEPFTIANAPGISIITSYVMKQRWGTPFDLPNYLNIDNLKTQLEIVFPILYTIANTPNLIPTYYPVSDDWKIDSFWAVINGVVAEYNYTEAWYKPVPGAIFLTRTTGGGQHPVSYLIANGLWLYSLSDEQGQVSVIGAGIGTSGGMRWQIQAFGIDPETGYINYAPDLGLHKFSASEFTIIRGGGEPPLSNRYDFGYFTVFRCGSMIFFDTDDPSFLNIPLDSTIALNNFETHSPPDSFSIAGQFFSDTAHSVVVAFVQPEEPVEIVMTAPYAVRFPLGLLINASERYPSGLGYVVQMDKQLILTNTPLKYAESYYWVNKVRISKVTIGIENLEKRNSAVYEMINASYRLLREYRYDAAYNSYVEAWHLGWQLYADIKTTIEDIVSTLPFFAALLIPFTFLAELFFFESRGIRKITLLVFIYLLVSGVFWFAHPGFWNADDAFAILLGSGGLILTTPAFVVVLSKFSDLVRRHRLKAIGPRFAVVGKMSRASFAFSQGVHNMRQRQLRTLLMLLSVILVTAGLVGFTSSTALTLLRATKMEITPAYNGVLLRHEKSTGLTVGIKILDTLMVEYSDVAEIAPRMWRYPLEWPFKVEANGILSYSPALSGVTPQEIDFTDVAGTIVQGRWFVPGDVWTCIIGTGMAGSLGISSLPATVSLMGYNLTVVGIVKDEMFDELMEFDGENPITPIDWSSPGMVPFKIWGLRGGIVLLPFETLQMIGGGASGSQMIGGGSRGIGTVAMRFRNETLIQEAAEKLFTRYGLETYFGVNNEVYVYSKVRSIQVFGWQFQIVPLVLVILSLTNMSLASMYERSREIKTLSSVGLSPLDVSIIFLAESSTYAILGGPLGYIAMVGLISHLGGLLPSLSFNPSSSLAMISFFVALLATMASAIYPMFKVSRVVVPSLERRWKLPTKPIEDKWNIPLPFMIRSDEESEGILVFFSEFIESHRGEDMPIFTTEDVWRIEQKEEERELKSINMRLTLPPREAGIRQEAEFVDLKDLRLNTHLLEIRLHRLNGSYSSWERANYDFVDAIRKHLFLWRSLPMEKKIEYMKGG